MNIQGKIVTLRALERTDLQKLQLFANDRETQQGIGETYFPSSMNFHEKWYERIDGDSNNLRLGIETQEHGLVGISSIMNIDSRNRRGWHGIMIGDARCRGKGIGMDTIMTTMRYAFNELNLNRLDGSMLETNRASIRLYCDKLGWVEEGKRRSYYYRDGQYFDQILVGILKSDYEEKAKELKYWETSK